jgi:hypothetical protein
VIWRVVKKSAKNLNQFYKLLFSSLFMNKEVKVFVVLLFLTLFLVSFASAFSFSEFWNKITGKATEVIPNCTDSDGGLNYSVKGFLTSNANGWNPSNSVADKCALETEEGSGDYSFTDSCNGSSCKLLEYYCNGLTPDINYKNCPYGCKEGRWIKESNDYEAPIIEDTCIPKMCSEMGKDCGNWDNGCNEIVPCGDCDIESSCKNGVCIQKELLPTMLDSSVFDCSYFEDSNHSLNILFIKMGNNSKTEEFFSYEEVVNEAVNSLKTISPFRENINKIKFYSLDLSKLPIKDPPLNCHGNIGEMNNCNKTELFFQITKTCPLIKNPAQLVNIIIFQLGPAGSTGNSGGIIYINSRYYNNKTILHEIGHSFLLPDLYPNWVRDDGTPSGSPYSRLNGFFKPGVDVAGCPTWCRSYKPVSRYTLSPTSQCLKFTNKNECISYERDTGVCKWEGNFQKCCVWSDTKFDYFNTSCVPAWGTENIGVNCLNDTGCYFAAKGDNYAWRPIIDEFGSIMYYGQTKFNTIESNWIKDTFNCCFSSIEDNFCDNTKKNFSNLLTSMDNDVKFGFCERTPCNISCIEDDSLDTCGTILYNGCREECGVGTKCPSGICNLSTGECVSNCAPSCTNVSEITCGQIIDDGCGGKCEIGTKCKSDQSCQIVQPKCVSGSKCLNSQPIGTCVSSCNKKQIGQRCTFNSQCCSNNCFTTRKFLFWPTERKCD